MRILSAWLILVIWLLTAFSFSAFAQEAKAETPYAYPQAEVMKLDLFIQPYHYLQLVHTPKKKIYPAMISVNEEPAQRIGIQLRGRSSLRVGQMTQAKRVPFELRFDYAKSDCTFRGNPSLKLINSFTPARLVSQIIAMQTFAFLQIPSPQITPAFIRINDVDFGLYLAAEDVNDAFLERCYPGGTLVRPYDPRKDQKPPLKCAGHKFYGKVDRGHETLDALMLALRDHTDVTPYVDADAFLRYFACEAFLHNTDGFTFGRTNYYLCEYQGKVFPVPWDVDDVFCVFTESSSLLSFETGGSDLFARMMQHDDYRHRYRQYMRQLVDDFLCPDTFLPWLDAYIQALAPYMDRDQTTLLPSKDTYSALTNGNCLYNALYGNLLLTLREYQAQLKAQMDDPDLQFVIPDGSVVSLEDDHTQDLYRETEGRKILFQICKRYGQLRRSVYWASYGTQILLLCAFFVPIFILTVLSVYCPCFARKHRAPRTHDEKKK